MRPILLLACLAAPLAARAAWPAAPAPVDILVEQALRSNLALSGESMELERASQRLDEARGALLPRLDAYARYTEASGGRTIDVPVGDLLNEAYATLNQLLASQGLPPRFGQVQNQSIPFLRSREQQTSLMLTQALYRPEITRTENAAKLGVEARRAELAAFRRKLRADVHEAFFRHDESVSSLGILGSALALVQESLRVQRSLAANGRATDDAVLRAEAEVALVRQQLEEARRDEDAALGYLNFLLNRPLGTPVDPLPEDDAGLYAAALRSADAGQGDVSGREELLALDRSRGAAREAADAVRARSYPTLGLALEGGIQGEGYQSSPGRNYAQGSLVLDWNLFDGSRTRSQEAQARIDERQVERRRQEAGLQLNLELRTARREFQAAATALDAAEARRRSARSAFALVQCRESEGLASELTVLDARTTLTDSELNYAATRSRLFIAAARLDQSAALSPAP